MADKRLDVWQELYDLAARKEYRLTLEVGLDIDGPNFTAYLLLRDANDSPDCESRSHASLEDAILEVLDIHRRTEAQP